MKNRWSDAARVAALAVRKARAMMANPRNKGQGVPKRGGTAKIPSPIVHAGGSATFEERTGTRNNPGKNVWIPPNGGKGTQYEEGMKELEGKKLLAAKQLPKPNIFYSSVVPGPLDRQTNQAIRYDPKNPYHPQSPMPPKRPPVVGGKRPKAGERARVIIGGKRYTRVGNMLVPDEKAAPGQKTKTFYQI
jgi:hypothetical protein